MKGYYLLPFLLSLTLGKRLDPFQTVGLIREAPAIGKFLKLLK
jgi:hypothetical protein